MMVYSDFLIKENVCSRGQFSSQHNERSTYITFNFYYHFRTEWSVYHNWRKYEKIIRNDFSQQRRKEKSLSLLSPDVSWVIWHSKSWGLCLWWLWNTEQKTVRLYLPWFRFCIMNCSWIINHQKEFEMQSLIIKVIMRSNDYFSRIVNWNTQQKVVRLYFVFVEILYHKRFFVIHKGNWWLESRSGGANVRKKC